MTLEYGLWSNIEFAFTGVLNERHMIMMNHGETTCAVEQAQFDPVQTLPPVTMAKGY